MLQLKGDRMAWGAMHGSVLCADTRAPLLPWLLGERAKRWMLWFAYQSPALWESALILISCIILEKDGFRGGWGAFMVDGKPFSSFSTHSNNYMYFQKSCRKTICLSPKYLVHWLSRRLQEMFALSCLSFSQQCTRTKANLETFMHFDWQ